MKKTYTQKMKVSAGVCLLMGVLTANRAGASTLYFDPNGASAVTSGTYTWDTTSLEWATSSALTGSLVAWNSSDAAVFTAGSFTGSITVDVNSAINAAGFFDGNLTPPGSTVTFNGTGSINMPTGAQAAGVGGSDGNTVTFNVPITGSGAAPESEEAGVNALNLYAANTFTGGFILGSTSNGGPPGNDGVNINNSQSFGVGGSISSTSSTATREINTPLAAQSGAFTLNQTLSLWNGILEFQGVQSAPVTISGAVTLSTAGTTSTLQVQSTTDVGAGNTTLTLSGKISGAGNIAKTGVGTLVFSGTGNNYTGSTTITAGTLAGGANNVFASSSSIVLGGGTLAMNGFNQTTTGTMGLTASSTISFLSGSETLSIANSSGVAWTAGKTLSVTGYAMNNLGQTTGDWFVGVGGLSTAQLAEITIDGESGAYITQAGDALGAGLVEVPEPSTLALGAMGGLGMLWMIKRRKTA